MNENRARQDTRPGSVPRTGRARRPVRGTEPRGARILLTGAAGALGAAIADLLVEHGADLVLVDRDADAAQRLADKLSGRGTDVEVHAADLLDDSAVDALVDATLADGPLDAVIVCHGVEVNQRFDQLTREQIDQQLGIHLRSPMMLVHRLLPDLLRSGGGHVVVVSSLNGKLPFPGKVPYAAAKAGSIAMVHALRRDLASTPVRFSVVLPGLVAGDGQGARAMAASGARPPRAVGTVTVRQCADGILTALRDGRAEVTVASPLARIAPALQWTVPAVADRIMERTGVLAFWRRMSARPGERSDGRG